MEENSELRTTTTSSSHGRSSAPRIRGEVLDPGHPRYEEARDIDNRLRRSRPALVAECLDESDVAAAIRWAVETGMSLSVRAGGHHAAGFASVEDGLVIDLRRIDHVRVDPQRREVSIGGGALAGAVDAATGEAGMATTTPTVSTVGMGGFALGGGISHLARSAGLAVDNILGARVVLADGRIVIAGPADEGGDPDLLWALRGGGGNFGVVTELRMRLHPVGTVIGGPMMFPIERTEDIVRIFRDRIPELPEEISAFLATITLPPQGPFPEELLGAPMCALIWCSLGSPEATDRALADFRALCPVLDGVDEMPYTALQQLFDAPAAMSRFNCTTGLVYRDLPDAAVTELAGRISQLPTPVSTSHIYPVDGAAARPGPNEAAWPWRQASLVQLVGGMAPEPEAEPVLRTWAEGVHRALAGWALPGGYANFQMDEGAEAAHACYGDHLERLVSLKSRYDPENVFCRNQNIDPSR